jgi:hypothetical protein
MLTVSILVLAGGCAVNDEMQRGESINVPAAQATSAAQSACMAAVNSKSGGNVKQINVVSSEFSEANSMVFIEAGGERWRCLASNDGQVIEELILESGKAAGNSRQSISAAENACLAAVSQQTSNRDVTILSSEYSEASSLVMVGVGANRASWRCLASSDGVVSEVMFTGDEGKL